MFSKKEDFTNTIQYKLGIRFDDLTSKSYQNINELADFFIEKNKTSKWKTLNFLQTYYHHKSFLEEETNQTLNSNTNLNQILNKHQKTNYFEFLKQHKISPIELSRPNYINTLIIWFPIIGVLGVMLISTYLITKKDWSGWTYLSGLVGIIIWLLIIHLSKPLKTKFNPELFLDYIKSTYVIRYKELSKKELSPQLVKQFIQDELLQLYNKTFSFEENIPND